MALPTEIAALAAMHDLIAVGTSFDAALERIYHESLKVLMVAPDGQVSASTKQDFKPIFQAKLDDADPPVHTAARLLHTDINEKSAHVILERSVSLGSVDQDNVFSIDLTLENNRWQVTREVILAKSAR